MEQEEQEQQEYRPCIQDGEQRVFDNSIQSTELMTIDQCETIREMDDSQLVGAPPTLTAHAKSALTHDVNILVRNDVKAMEMSTGKRKRGRPPRIQGKAAPPQPLQRKKRDEEDVCFICFDGGSLVLCDRRGCPKAYHPACIKRDESFFRSKARWNCGWHICSSCQKASHFMCFTCTYSLCKGCMKDADYFSVRGTKGFCGTCMGTIMLIENISLGHKEMVQVDFDDKTSWEYLFKVYWIYLKAKLSLTLDELTNAKNPWKGEELPKAKASWKGVGTNAMGPGGEYSGELYNANNENGSCLDNYCGNLDANHPKRRKTKNQPNFVNEENSMVMEKPDVEKVTDLTEGTSWATKELLEFVAHMKNGDISVLSQFDVQSLLLEYIKRNKLRDPRQKCQIVCDPRLMSLFGKTHVGHFEMLKLLEYHFLIKEKSLADSVVRAGLADTVGSQVETAGNSDRQLTMGNDRRRKTRKKTDEKRPHAKPNPDEYAAVDVHNINLLYLKRSLMENLMDDAEKFHDKVVGSFVRIRISGGDQKQDMYRLVQVVGTSKVAESYKVGTRTTDILLDILNLDKKESVSIDVISNQEFSEDECQRLRQIIKCGLIKRMTVGEIQEKAMVLQAVKVGDWLEAEILRLNHLRDRASEKGHRRELREFVEKLELLKSPEEQQRRLLEIPNVHTDPNMDPSYESEEDAGESDENKQGDHVKPTNTGVGKQGAELNSTVRASDVSNDMGHKPQKNLGTSCELNKNVMTFYVDRDGTIQLHKRVSETAWSQGDVFGLHKHNAPMNWVVPNGSLTGDCNSQVMVRSESLSGIESPVLPLPHSPGRELSVNDVDTEKLWHYQDPTGKIQGPFSLNQLRKWSTNGLFPLDLRVWRINEKQEYSILLTDALVGQFHKEPPPGRHSSCLVYQDMTVASNDKDKLWECGLSQNTAGSSVNGKKVDNGLKLVQNGASVHYNDSDKLVRSSEWSSHSSSWTTAVDIAIASDGWTQKSLHTRELSEGGQYGTEQPQMYSLHPSSSSSGKLCETPLKATEGHGDEKLSSSPSTVNYNQHRTTECPTRSGKCIEKPAESLGYSSQSSGQNWRPPATNSSSSKWDSDSGFVSMAKSIETSENNQVIDISSLSSPTPKQSEEDLKGQAAEKQSVSSNVPVPDSGPSWSTASSVVVGGAQLPEVAGDWGGYSSAPAKPSAEEWDSNLVSASSLKPTEGASDHTATPTPESGQLTYSSTTEPAIDTSIWQPIVPEPNEFSLVDESVSDLLAEVEAMESLGGLPSPTSKMSCGGELTQDSDNDCLSPVEGFSPALDPGKSDALSSTGDIQISSQLIAADEPLDTCQMSSRQTVADEPLGVSQLHSHSTITDEPLGLSHNVILNPRKSFSGHSSTSAEVDGDTKRSDVSVNQGEAGSETQLPASTVNQGESGVEIQPPTQSTVSQWEAGSHIQRSAPSTTDCSRGNMKRHANTSQGGVAQGNVNMVSGTGHVTVQPHASMNSANSTGNPGSWGSQLRPGGDRYSGSRDHRNYFQGRDSGFGSQRSSWNKQPSFGVGNGGGSYRHPPKGQRVCKFYESGYCRKGASCSYWHP